MSDAEDSPESAGPSDDLVGTLFAERYRVEALLGQGAMGTVYRAEHIHMKKAVAIKLLNPEIAGLEEMAARFEREAIAAARIEHPHVAKAMDYGRLPNGGYYLVLEFVRGKSLTELLQNGALSPARAMRLTRQMADAMSAAHAAGVVHRDLKPDNVMLADRDDGADVVKVLDFGVAKLTREAGDEASPITRFGAVLGTPEYMAPEQAGGTSIDHRADLYAVGVMLYEMLAGRPPFQGVDAMSVLTKQLTEAPPPLPSTIPPQISAIVLDLVKKEPADRIQSADELIARIDRAFAEIEAAATVITMPERTFAGTASDRSPTLNRRALGLPLAAGAILVAVIGIGAAVAYASRPAVETLHATHTRVEVPKVTPEPQPAASDSPVTASAVLEADSAEPAASAPAPTKTATKERTASKPKPAPRKPAPKPKRKTGPFGIYIPPPSEW